MDREALSNEVRVGRSLAAKLAKRYGVVREEKVTAYLTLLARSLAQQSRPELTFHAGILDTDDINAFSCPGGYVFVTRGALLTMQSEGELAFVLAHEISHTALQHAGSFRESGGLMDVITGALAGPGGNVVNSAVRSATGELESILLERGRQRELEFDADEAGVVLAASQGYDPAAAVAYIARLNQGRVETLSRTHPSTEDRTARLKRFILENQITPRPAGEQTNRFAEFQQRLAQAKQ